MEFHVGDTVICVDDHSTGRYKLDVIQGMTYTVNTPGRYIIGLEGVASLQYAWRFVKVEHSDADSGLTPV